MDFIWFNLFSTIESVGMFVLMLAIFRFKIKHYIAHIVFASFLLSQASYYMRVDFDLGSYVPLVFIALTFLFVWLMFRVPVYYSAVMAVFGFIASIILQGILILLILILNLSSLDDVAPFTLLAYVVQLITCAITFLISWLLLRKRIGFTFVPFSESLRIKLRGENSLFLIIMLLIVIVVGVQSYWALQGLYTFIIVNLILVIIYASLVYLAIRKERKDD